MKIRFLKRALSSIAAAALLVSSFGAITVSAEDDMAEMSSPVTVTASVAAQMRANEDTWATQNKNSSKILTDMTSDIETTAKSHMGAFYYFDPITLPEDAAITKATLSVYQGSQTFSGKHFMTLHTENPKSITNIEDIFAVIKDAKAVESDTATAAQVQAGQTSMVEPTDESGNKTGKRIETVDITGYFDDGKSNSYFLYNTDAGDGNRRLTGRAEIIVEYASAEAAIIRGNETKKYAKFEDAYLNAEAGDTIKLLADTTTTKGLSFNKGDLTIDGNGKTIHNGSHYIAIDGSGTLTLSNLTIDGTSNVEIKGNSKLNSDNLTISHLQINGSTIASKGTVKNSAIDTLRCFGKLTLENSTVANIALPNINYGSGDSPQITSDSDFKASSIVIDKISNLEASGIYTLFAGEYKPETVTINESYAENYRYFGGIVCNAANGYIIAAQTGITPDKVTAQSGETVTLTVADDNYVANSLTASYEPYAHNLPWGGTTDAPYSLPIESTGANTYTFTMPADDVNVTALFRDEDEIVVASQDQAYSMSNYSGDSWHYIQTNEKSLVLDFDLTGKTIAGKKIKLILKKQGGAPFTQTSVRLATTNPWASGSFAQFEKAANTIATATQAGNDFIEFEIRGYAGGIIDNHLYLNVEMDEGSSGNDYYGIRADSVHGAKQAPQASYLPRIELIDAEAHDITTQDGITASAATAEKGETITLTGNYAAGSLFVKSEGELLDLTRNDNGTYSFTMPNADVDVTGLVNTEDKIFVVADSAERVKTADQNDNNNYYIKKNNGIGLTFTIPDSVIALTGGNKTVTAKLHFIRSNGATNQKTNIYKQDSFTYVDAAGASGFIAQYGGGSVSSQNLPVPTESGEYKLLIAYDSSVSGDPSGNDYHVVNATNGKSASDISQLPYIVFSAKEKLPMPEKQVPDYPQITDNDNTQDAVFQYHYSGGLTTYNNGETTTGKAYDAYLWVPQKTAPGQLKGIVAIKLNLIEVPLANSDYLRAALTEKNFGIMFYVSQKDAYGYNNIMNDFRTKEIYTRNSDGTYTASENPSVGELTTDGKDAKQILNEALAGLAEASGYSELNTIPMVTIGHSAAAGFGNKAGQFDPNRIIAGIHMKNGMSAGSPVEGVPILQYAAQYTEHANNTDRDRSVRDARYHIANERSDPNNLITHIIEWGSGHYDWSDNATYMMTEYIKAAIDARVPNDYATTHKLNDLTGTGYIMKPFEKDSDGAEQEAGYYRDYLQGWLSSGQNNAGASDADKTASFWFFSEELANKINKFTNYAIPESPDSSETGVFGKTYSEIEPFMLMRESTFSTAATRNAGLENLISPQTNLGSGFSRYGAKRFVNYSILANPNANPDNAANLGGYGDVMIDTYYMSKIPELDHAAFENVGGDAYVPQNQKAEFVPLIAPYEVVKSELLDTDNMSVDSSNSEAANVASVTRTTLRFHNNRAYYRSGNKTLNAQLYGDANSNSYGEMDSYGFIKSPELRGESGYVTSAFKAMSSQMTIPYVNKGTAQTLELAEIKDVNVYGATKNPTIAVNYTSSDEELQKYTDVFVDYGPAKAERTVNEDGSYSWKIEILREAIPENASFPIEVNVVASNLGKWESTYGATTTQTFNIISNSELAAPQIVIGDISSTENEITVSVSVENPTEETQNGVLIAALYDENDSCVQVEIVEDEIVKFDKIGSGHIKAFLWSSFNQIKPILGAEQKEIK